MFATEQAKSRIALFVSHLHGWIPKDESLAIVAVQRDSDPVTTFLRVCETLRGEGVVIPGRLAVEVRFIGTSLGLDASEWACINYYAPAA